MTTKDSTNGKRNWSELPQEILHLFSQKLPYISDFICFRAVCKMWQLSAPVTDPPPQLPWLVKQCENDILRFYCLSSGKVHTITCPSSGWASMSGPTCRYLLAENLIGEMYLLNPLTHDQIHAPIINDGGWWTDYIGPDPIEGGDIVVISGYMCAVANPHNVMPFWRPKADHWDYVEGVGGGGSHWANAFCMGQYFSIDEVTGIMNVVDIATKKMAYQVTSPEGTNPLLKSRKIIVESGGKILRLFNHSEAEPCHFDIYCLNLGDGEGKPCWVKITDIGDQMLFLEYNRGLSFCASNFAGFKGNCIYFMKKSRYLCRYDIGDGTTEVLPWPFDSFSMYSWLVPSLL